MSEKKHESWERLEKAVETLPYTPHGTIALSFIILPPRLPLVFLNSIQTLSFHKMVKPQCY